MRVLCFGSLNIDHVYQVEKIARAGETVASSGYALCAGGKGANQSAALARAGAPVSHAGMVGPDGDWLVDRLAREGVDMGHTRRGTAPTGHAIIQVDRSGENSIVIHAGSNAEIDKPLIEAAITSHGQDDILLLQNEISGIHDIINKAADQGMTICFNPAPFASDVLDYPNERVHLFILNESEASGLAGCATAPGAVDPGVLAEQLRDRFPAAEIVITLGAAGALFLGDQTFQVAAPTVEAVDTTGAGDTFIGYFLASRTTGAEPREAMHRAVTAAALCVTRTGTQDSIPRRDEVDMALRVHALEVESK